MGKKRFSLKYLDNMPYVKDNLNSDEYYLYWAVEWMNELYEENEVLKEEKKQLHYELQEIKELLKLIADACTYTKEHSVKEILRKEIEGIDSVAGEFASAWHDYVILSKFFKEYYKEYWDND